MTATPRFSPVRVHVPEIRVYKPAFRFFCERITFSIDNSRGYKAARIALLRRVGDPVAEILNALDTIEGIEMFTLETNLVTVQFARNTDLDKVEAEVQKVLKRHPGS